MLRNWYQKDLTQVSQYPKEFCTPYQAFSWLSIRLSVAIIFPPKRQLSCQIRVSVWCSPVSVMIRFLLMVCHSSPSNNISSEVICYPQHMKREPSDFCCKAMEGIYIQAGHWQSLPNVRAEVHIQLQVAYDHLRISLPMGRVGSKLRIFLEMNTISLLCMLVFSPEGIFSHT